MSNLMSTEAEDSILVVDDDANILDAVSSLIKSHSFSVVPCENAAEALNQLNENRIIVVLTDIKMPVMSGIDLLEKIRNINPEIPVILMTAYPELDIAVDALKCGAFDFVTKPYNGRQLIRAIEKAIQHYKTAETQKNYQTSLEEIILHRTKELSDALFAVEDMNVEIIQRLSAAAEFRDTDTGTHISRIGYYSRAIAEALDLRHDFVEAIALAAPLHDIGKIGIPDNILLKPGALTAEEFEIMKAHTTIGNNILAGSSNPTIQLAASIALNHHERWRGGGYPRGLRGNEIPLEGRIVVLVDHYDALRSKRPYKRPFTHEEAVRIITEGDERTSPEYFDPNVLSAFIKAASFFDSIFSTHQC